MRYTVDPRDKYPPPGLDVLLARNVILDMLKLIDDHDRTHGIEHLTASHYLSGAQDHLRIAAGNLDIYIREWDDLHGDGDD
jgi:hypothetical protein